MLANACRKKLNVTTEAIYYLGCFLTLDEGFVCSIISPLISAGKCFVDKKKRFLVFFPPTMQTISLVLSDYGMSVR